METVLAREKVPAPKETRPAFRGGLDAETAPASAVDAALEKKLGEFRVLGVLGKLYILMENASGLVLVDQHAAHERILFEQLRRRLETQGVATQKLLLPLTIEVSPRDHDWLTLNLPQIQRMGIGLEPFGVTTYKVDSLPQFVKLRDPQAFLWQVIDDLRAASQTASKLRLGEEMIAKTVCRHAIKANDDLAEREIHALLRDLLACELPYCCPHGRPTMIQISYPELEKKFGRIQP
jgi:DNA mismatch repair protein MutL